MNDSRRRGGDLPARNQPAATEAATERSPLPVAVAARSVARCVLRSAALLLGGRVRTPDRAVGGRLRFADGTSAPVYRETVLERDPPAAPCSLVVRFRLRGVRGRGHAAFRAESLLNTPLFVGFPGFVSKLWLAADENGAYRGVYEWDGPELAHAYARALWRVLELVSVSGSIGYAVVPGLHRDDLVAAPAGAGTAIGRDWWRPVRDGEPASGRARGRRWPQGPVCPP